MSAALRPISESALRAMPQTGRPVSGLQLTLYQPGTGQTSSETSTVNGELRKLFQKNGQTIPSVRTRDLPNTNSPTIRMVRHRNDASESQKKEAEAKKAPLLKRFLNTFKPKKSGNEDEFLTKRTAIPVIPPPPPIVFDETSHVRPGSTGNSVPARVAGFQKNNGQSVFGTGRSVSGLQLTLYQPGTGQTSSETSTVNGELRKLFQKNGQTIPSVRTRDLPNTNSPTIRMVRHRNDASESQKKEAEAKKAPLLKRFLNTFKPKKSGNEDEFLTKRTAIPVIPPPPPIVFDETSHVRPGSTGNSVPARVAGFQKNNGQSVFGVGRPRIAATSNQDAAQPLIQQPQLPPAEIPLVSQPEDQKPVGSDSRYQQPPQLQVLRDDGFVDPFGEPEPTSDDDALLDLDSLINAANAKNDDISVPALPEDARDPATGHGLNSDEPLFTEQTEDPAASSQTDEVVTDVQPTRTLPAETESKTAIDQTQNGSEETAAADLQSQFPEVPPSGPEDTATSSDRPKETWTPSAETVAKGRALATPIEIKPDPERLRQLSDRARREELLYRIMSRTGQIGFKGFCPVVLRDQRELIDGRTEYLSKYGLKTYDFSSPEAKATFDANPSRYAPAGGGSDVVLLVNTNEEVAGILDFSLWYRDRLYMFRSRETQAIFSGDPERYASQY